jgi:hypothetical protein
MDIGERLRSARESKGLTIDVLARTTRVQARLLEAVERNDWHALPPRPYGRGCVRAYANEVGLEPDRTVREFFSQFTSAAIADGPTAVHRDPADAIAPGDTRRRALIGTLLTCGLAAAFILFIGRGMLRTGSEPPPVGTTGAAEGAPASTAGVTPAVGTPAVAPAAAAPAPVAPLTISLEATAPSWITASADGRRVLYRMLQPGEREAIHAGHSVRFRIGDAGAVRWQVNGRPAAIMGAPGEVRTVVVTAENAASVK